MIKTPPFKIVKHVNLKNVTDPYAKQLFKLCAPEFFTLTTKKMSDFLTGRAVNVCQKIGKNEKLSGQDVFR